MGSEIAARNRNSLATSHRTLKSQCSIASLVSEIAISGVRDGHRNRKSQKSPRFRCAKRIGVKDRIGETAIVVICFRLLGPIQHMLVKTIFETLLLPVAKILSPVARQAPTKVAKSQGDKTSSFCRRMSGRNERCQHQSLPWNFMTHGSLHLSTSPETRGNVA